MKIINLKAADIDKKWLLVDAANQPLGRVASQVAYLLRGKHKPNYTTHLDNGDHVIVINASKVALTGKKWDDKVYYRHTNYVGGIKAVAAQDLFEMHPDRLLSIAVKGMLPKNKLGKKMLTNMRIYTDDQHPHVAQRPANAASRLVVKGGDK